MDQIDQKLLNPIELPLRIAVSVGKEKVQTQKRTDGSFCRPDCSV